MVSSASRARPASLYRARASRLRRTSRCCTFAPARVATQAPLSFHQTPTVHTSHASTAASTCQATHTAISIPDTVKWSRGLPGWRQKCGQLRHARLRDWPRTPPSPSAPDWSSSTPAPTRPLTTAWSPRPDRCAPHLRIHCVSRNISSVLTGERAIWQSSGMKPTAG